LASIFVQIASFQDYELPRTIKDCILKASSDNEIFFGVHSCEMPNLEIAIDNFKNLKIEKSIAPKNLGVGLARYIANEFYDGQDYYLQIDSHTRFIQDWDKHLIDSYLLYKQEGLNPAITSYPGIYYYENTQTKFIENPSPSYISFKNTEEDQEQFKLDKILPQKSELNKDHNIFTKSVSGGCIFGNGNIANVKPNKKMYNWGEETLTAIRLFTNGFDLLIPQKDTLYHLYYNHTNDIPNQRILPKPQFNIEVENIIKESNGELFRVINNNIIGDQELGTVRTLAQYEYYAGVNFYSGKID
jgi:hypothetical protein